MVTKICKTNFFLKKKILISGSNGFIGSYFYDKFSKEHDVYKLNYKLGSKNFIDGIKKQLPNCEIDIYIHLAFNKKSISKNYHFINVDSLTILYSILEKKYKNFTFFYMSSLNVFLEKYYDKYTYTKLAAENKIYKFNNVKIIRIPLVISDKSEGDIYKLSKYVNIIPFISLVPHKGSIINYIKIDYLISKLSEIISSNDKEININNNEKIYLVDLAKKVAKKKIFFIRIDNYLNKILRYISPIFLCVDYEKFYNWKKNIHK